MRMEQNLNAKIQRMLKIIIQKDTEIDNLKAEIEKLKAKKKVKKDK